MDVVVRHLSENLTAKDIQGGMVGQGAEALVLALDLQDMARDSRAARMASPQDLKAAFLIRGYDRSNSKSETGLGRREGNFQSVRHELKERVPTFKEQVAGQGAQIIEKGFACA